MLKEKLKTHNPFLPVSRADCDRRGIAALDIVIISGDAYVDHPSYGAAIIGRALEADGFTVGIIAQPDPDHLDDFRRLGRPKLFFGVTAGNLDSMIANYTANRKPRREDEYAAGGKAGLRPDRATIVYANKAREAYKGVPIVIGGLEASMRRLAHYDYWSDKVRRSILLDAKADILAYGMAERPVIEIARRLRDGAGSLEGIAGTVIARKGNTAFAGAVAIPSFEEVSGDAAAFNRALVTVYAEADPFRGKAIVQKHGDRSVVQYPPAVPYTTDELDRLYGLPFVRAPHPMYDRQGSVPGFETVRFSVISNRGCCGECAFCSLALHQGRIVRSRSIESIVDEVRTIAADLRFKGTITDIGGATANLYMAECEAWQTRGACRGKRCLTPRTCSNLELGYEKMITLWKALKKVPGVAHVFVGSGVRYDLLLDRSSDVYLRELCAAHVSGQLKVAPEHCVDPVLDLMAKPRFAAYEKFVERFEQVNRSLGKEQYLVNYFINGHPGSGLEDALRLSLYLKKRHIYPEQIQDFIPLPMTLAGAMYYTGRDPATDKPIHVARTYRERMMQRALIQYKHPAYRKFVLPALRELGREDLARTFR